MLKKAIKLFLTLFAVIFVVEVIYFSTHIGNVAVIKLQGIITPTKAGNVIKSINRAKEDTNIKAVLFEVDSPGGEACSSEKIYLVLKKLSRVKPVVALIDTIGASGAYFAACGANKIVSYPASTVGSIGVIFETLNFHKLADKLGVSLFVVKTGPVKDVGNPFREPTKQDRAMLKGLIDNMYSQFLKAVSVNRKIPMDKLKTIADGSVFTGKQALKLKLVDSIGGKEQAIRYIKQLAHVKRVKLEDYTQNQGLEKRLLDSLYLVSLIRLVSQPTVKAIYQ